jgi:hypothetical protein
VPNLAKKEKEKPDYTERGAGNELVATTIRHEWGD